MSVTKKLVTKNFNVHNAAQFLESITEQSNNQYFVYVGNHIPYAGGDTILDDPTNSVKDTHLDVYNNMVFAKKVASSDVVHVIPRYNWTTDTVYDAYAHDDGDLYDKQFFIVTNDDTEYNVWKCLFNNNGANSTAKPVRAGSAADLEPIKTSDDYVWKYMYTITKTDFEKFASLSYVPVTPNTSIITGAVPGRIEVIKIVDAGKGYDNYIASGVFKTGDIRVFGSDTTYGAPETASTIDDYYRSCVLKITSGAQAGQFRRIVNYEGTGAQKLFILNEGFGTPPAVNDTYEVYPYIYVWGDGNETTPAEAIAKVDSTAANSISEVEILEPGAGYRYAEAVAGESSVEVPYTASSVFIDLPTVIKSSATFKVADLKAIVSPKGGHGSDPYTELGANRICISTKFNQSETVGGITIPIENDFRQIGLIKDPQFNNVEISTNTSLSVGSFSIGETVKQYKKIKLFGNVSISSTANTIIKTDNGVLASTITIVNGGTGYDNTTNNELVFTGGGGAGAAATFANNGSGAITSVTVTNQGSGYTSIPAISVNVTGGAGGSNAQFSIDFANPQQTVFKDAFNVGDYVLVNKSTQNYLGLVTNVPQDYQINCASNSTFTADNAELSKFEFSAEGVVTAVSTGQITLANVSGVFSVGSKIVGLASGATSVIRDDAPSGQRIQINDRNSGNFSLAVQLTRLVGDFTTGSTPFIEDEKVRQASLISAVQPSGYVHHAEIQAGSSDDILYISNEFGIFNLDPSGVREISGDDSDGSLSYLNNKYKGDFVKGSGQVLYYENLDPITRSGNKSEIVKIILEF